MRKILVILGGGRPRGNTRQLVDAFARGATDAGHEVEIVSLNEVQVNGCLGCNACRYGKPCIQKDGFNELVPKIKAADCVVFASPLLFWTISSKLKAFVERFYCIAEEDPNPPLGRYEKYPVNEITQIVKAVLHHKDGVSVPLQFSHDLRKPLGGRIIQVCGGLIEDIDLR